MISHMNHGVSEPFWVSSALIFAALVYLRGWLQLRGHEHDNVKSWRAGSFVFGLLFIWIATASPLATLDHEILTAHMVQHLLLMTFAPPLILFGTPKKLLAHSVLNPPLCWFAAAGTLVVWHIPSVFMLGLQSETWHGIEQASFLLTGLLFWWPVVRPWPAVSRWPESSLLLYLFLATLPCDILSGFLVFCDRVVYPVFLSSSQSFGLSALEDQQRAGAFMWTCVTVVYLIAAAIVATRLLSPQRSEEHSILRFESERSAAHTESQRMGAV